MPINDAYTILKAVANVRMANGDYAILVVDVFEPLLLSSRGTLISEFLAVENETSENIAVSTALQVTMIIKCHAESLLLRNGSFNSNFINKVLKDFGALFKNDLTHYIKSKTKTVTTICNKCERASTVPVIRTNSG